MIGQLHCAQAGFKVEDLSVQQQGAQLSIQGKSRQEVTEKEGQYVHQEISSKNFDLRFTLTD